MPHIKRFYLRNVGNALYFDIYTTLVQLAFSHVTQEGEKGRSQDRKEQEPSSRGKRGRQLESKKILLSQL